MIQITLLIRCLEFQFNLFYVIADKAIRLGSSAPYNTVLYGYILLNTLKINKSDKILFEKRIDFDKVHFFDWIFYFTKNPVVECVALITLSLNPRGNWRFSYYLFIGPFLRGD